MALWAGQTVVDQNMLVSAMTLAIVVAGTQQAGAAPISISGAAPDAPSVDVNAEQSKADITVRGNHPDMVQKIDRRVYRVPHDAKSGTSELLSLLRGLPAITIGLDDAVSLLGSQGVTILVNNRPPPNGNLVLRSLHGADIDHIEVLTNPSAENAPDGTGGIINIVLRTNRGSGVSGTVLTQADSFGGFQFDLTHKRRTGPWSFETELAYRDIVRKQTSFSNTLVIAPTGPSTNYRETGKWGNESHFLMASETIGYALDATTSLGLDAYIGTDRAPATTYSQLTGISGDFPSFDQRGVKHDRSTTGSFNLSVKKDGARKGESLKFSLGYNLDRSPSTQIETIDYVSPGRPVAYQFIDNSREDDFNLKLDVTHSIGAGEILSFGVSDTLAQHRSNQSFDNAASIASLGPGYQDMIVGTRNVAAAYVSFQQPIGKWTMLPAMRVEAENFRGSPAALPSFRVSAVSLFPSVHLSRGLGKYLDVNLSYARRTDRPQIDQLDPFRILTTTTSARIGNPGLSNQTTDAYETNFAFTRGSLVASMILYDRETSKLWSSLYSGSSSGVITTQQINSGHKSDRGAEFDIDTPVRHRLKLTTSLNLFDSCVPVDDGEGLRQENELRYTGNATVDWKLPSANGNDVGDLQAQLTYESARHLYQTSYKAQLSGNLTLTCPVTKTVAAVLEVENAFGTRRTRQSLDTGQTRQTLEQQVPGPRFKIKLVRNFGNQQS